MSQEPENTATVQILDKDYLFGCQDDERQALYSAARYLDSKMREIRRSGKTIGLERIAVMAALNITYEMMQGGSNDGKEDENSEERQQRIELLIEKLDGALLDHRQLEL